MTRFRGLAKVKKEDLHKSILLSRFFATELKENMVIKEELEALS